MAVLAQIRISVFFFISSRKSNNCVVQIGVVRATLCHTLATPLHIMSHHVHVDVMEIKL